MSAETSLESIEAAVLQFYSPDEGSKTELNRYLIAVQNNAALFPAFLSLLGNDRPEHVQHYALNSIYATLRNARDTVAVWSTQLESLLSSMLTGSDSASHNHVLRTKLVQCLVAYLLATSGPDLQRRVREMLISTEDELIRLEIVRMLPEELPTFNLEKTEKSLCKSQLMALAYGGEFSVLSSCLEPVLLKVLASPDDDHNTNCGMLAIRAVPGWFELGKVAIRAVPGWFELGKVAIRAVPGWFELGIPLMTLLPVLESLFRLVELSDEEWSPAACEVIQEVLCSPLTFAFSATVTNLLPRLTSLSRLLEQNRKNSEVVFESLCKLLVAVGENHTNLLVDTDSADTSAAIVEYRNTIIYILACPGIFGETEYVSELPFTLLYQLQDELTARADLPPETMRGHLAWYASVMQIMVSKCDYPDEEVMSGWSEDQSERFRCYRQDLADSLVYFKALLGILPLQYLYSRLEAAANDPSSKWQQVETAMYLLSNLADYYVGESSQTLTRRLFALLQKMSFSSTRVVSTALDMIGSFSELVGEEEALFNMTLDMCCTAIQNPALTASASMTLKEAVQTNSHLLGPHAARLTQLISSVLKEQQLTPKEQGRLIFCIGCCLSSSRDLQGLEELLAVLLPNISLQNPALDEFIEVLSWLVDGVGVSMMDDSDEEEPLKPTAAASPLIPISEEKRERDGLKQRLVESLLPPISAVMREAATQDLITSCFVFLQHALRENATFCVSVLPQFLQLTTSTFSRLPTGATFEFQLQLLIHYYSADRHDLFLSSGCSLIADLHQMFVEQRARNEPDVVMAFWNYIHHLAKKHSALLNLPEEAADQLGRIALATFQFTEKATLRSFAQAVAKLYETASLLPLQQRYLPFLLPALVSGIADTLPRSCVHYFAVALLHMRSNHLTPFKEYLTAYSPPEVPPAIMIRVRGILFTARASGTQFKAACEQLALYKRGLANTEYAAATSGINY